jgi:DNA replication protein
LSREPFPGFPARCSFTPLPDVFFSRLLPETESLTELKVVLHIFWRLYRKQSSAKLVTLAELLADRTLLNGLSEREAPSEMLTAAINSAVDHGILLRFMIAGPDGANEAFTINNIAGKATAEKLGIRDRYAHHSTQSQPRVKREVPNIFALYEKNIGLLTPMIAEELKEAEGLYPEAWIEEAFREAASLNKRNWRYIARILERWSTEGKDSGESGRGPKKDRYIKGKYGHLIRR